MDTKQINDALDRIFREEDARIVFWNDPEREFLTVLPFLLLDGVTTIRLDQEPALGVKIRLGSEDPTGKRLRHHADMRIALDLDDGVKVNYGKFGGLLAEVKAVTGGREED